jgi:hypothetical protein
MPSHLRTESNLRAIASAIGLELRTYCRPPNGHSPELRGLLRKIACSGTRDLANWPRGSHEMRLTDDEPRRLAEISLQFLSR